MASVRFERVTKDYGALRALDGVSFECREGEFFSLFGPSGAGKTTILRIIAGIGGAYDGSVFFDGRPMNNVPPQRRGAAMAFESYALYPHMTAGENIAFPMRAPNAPRRTESEISRRTAELAERLDILPLLERLPRQLSGGQKQRVSLARALGREASVYLLDEPIAHLDAKLRAIARTDLKDMAVRLGATIVYVTHDYREALGLSDRILILNSGRVEQIDSPSEIYTRPATDFAAWLVGDPTINLVDGALERRAGSFVFVSGPVTLLLTGRSGAAAEARWSGTPAPCRLGVRPADVRLTPERGNAEGFPLPIYAVERDIKKTRVYFELENALFTVVAPRAEWMKIGQTVWVIPNADQAHLFDATFPSPGRML